MKVEKISQNQVFKGMMGIKVQEQPKQPQESSIKSLMDSDSSATLKSIINFKGAGKASEYAKSFVSNTEIRVPDLFNISENIHLSLEDMEPNQRKLNTAGLNIVKTEGENSTKIKIKNDKENVIFEGEVEKGAETPKVIYKQGKYMPEITLKDEHLNGSVVKMFSGSKVEGDGFKFVMPGDYTDLGTGKNKNISFTGNTVITTLNKEPRTQNAVDLYMSSDLIGKTTKGDYTDIVEEYQPTVVIPAGGFGERFKNMTREAENKPSYMLPTADEYRIIATALNMASAAGVIDEDSSKNNLTYLSQNHEIEGENIKQIPKYKTDGGAIAYGLDEDYIDRHKDMIVLNGDIISNADITRAYKALKTLPHAALVIPYYPVNAERAKSFGLLGFDEDEYGNTQLTSFVEKTPYTDKSPLPEDFSSDEDYKKAIQGYIDAQKALSPIDKKSFLANPGIYLLSEEATKVLRHMGIKDPASTGLGGSVMPEIVRLCNEGKLVDKDGNKMKAYTVPLETKGGKPAFWDDIGTAEAYLSTIKQIAKETSEKGTGVDNFYYGMPTFVLEDFVKNADLDTGVLYMSDESRANVENFKEQHNVSEFCGNIFAV